MESRPFKAALLSTAVLALSTTLVGCDKAQSEPSEQAAVVKPVKLVSVASLMEQNSSSFLARIDATKRAQLSFQVPGEVESLKVKMGEDVAKGQILATLDPQDLQVAYDAANAQYALAAAQWERANQLYKKKLISAAEFDQKETNYKAALASRAQAKTDLDYTEIHAPFDGVISYTHVNAHQVVGANQQILNLIDNTKLDVSFTLPVTYVEANGGLSKLSEANMWVTMDSEPSVRIQGAFKEVSTEPNIDTNSYQAIVSIDRPQGRNLLTGMTGLVHIQESLTMDYPMLPNSAWIERQQESGDIWVMNSETKQVSKITVSLNSAQQVVSGLDKEDLVVVAGVETLSEGQIVKQWQREGGI